MAVRAMAPTTGKWGPRTLFTQRAYSSKRGGKGETPKVVDWEKYMDEEVKDQRTQDQYKDCCTYIAIAEVMQGLTLLHKERKVKFSVDHFVKESTEKGYEFTIMKDALNFVKKHGLIKEEDYLNGIKKAERFKIQSFTSVWGKKHILKTVSKGPAVGGLHVHRAIVEYRGGIITQPDLKKADRNERSWTLSCRTCRKDKRTPFWCRDCGYNGQKGHAIALTGYNLTNKSLSYLHFKNCWSNNWGERGYGKIHLPISREAKDLSYFDQKRNVYVSIEEDIPDGVANIECAAWVLDLGISSST